MRLRGAGKIPQLADIGSGDQYSSHHDSDQRPCVPGRKQDFRSDTSVNSSVTREMQPPAVRSQVRVNVIRTRFMPASTGTSVCPVPSRALVATALPFTSTRQDG